MYSSYHSLAWRDRMLRFYINLCRREAAEGMITLSKAFWADNIQAAADYCRGHFSLGTALTLSIADELLQNRYLFRDHWEMERTHKAVTFAGAIDWEHLPADDIEWCYAMNRHTSFVNLGKAWRYTGEEKYAQKYAELIGDWIDRVPLRSENQNGTWRSLEAGLRCESWLRALRLFKNTPLLTPPLLEKIERCLLVHGSYLATASGDFHRLSNWGVLQDHGLYLLGVYFDREDWRALAVRRLEEQLALQVFGDGSHWEQSPMYHCEVLHCASDVVLVARQAGFTLPNDMVERVHSMYTALAKWLTPTGRLVCQSDSDDTDARDIVAQGALLFGDGYLRWAAGEAVFEENVWDFGAQAAELFGRLQPQKPALPSTVLPDSGNYMLRGGYTPDAAYLHLHCGCLGSGHGHADLLHIDLSAFGEDILIDSGRYTYVNTPLRRQLKQPAAHNTITVDGVNFSECVDSWGYSQLAPPLKGEYRLTAAADYISGSHLGYFDLPGGAVLVTRSVVFLKPKLFVVFDRITARGSHSYRQHFHLGQGSATLEGDTLRWQGKRAAMTLCSMAGGTTAISRAPYSRDYNLLEEGDLLTVDYMGGGSQTLITILAVEERGSEQTVACRLLPVTTTRLHKEIPADVAQAVEITLGREQYTVIACHGEVISEVDLLCAEDREGYGKLIIFTPEQPLGKTLIW